ncbi:mitochondrial cytochrome c oxidase subunit VIa [Trametes versicolor FP-101664 SS1]|uniref:mitochondrial cytochrome c oxidase subunit VIa n=1 Tax=Trametes versicolor (strain FP-101664) TaxID=717944 RepID=UPI0004623DFB|nr:mitochondrial cytochrome c oxidase subunit VIa [Trametes versicolor FP-101664 SS1]EIW64320.1 mitochondrial cytochrome c oxidase subunit VIa [Trametes versicolor FP-101664 SS1]
MSMLAARRAALRAVPRTRNFAAAAGKSTYRQEMEATVHHAEETTELWRKISFYVCIPAIAVCALWVRNVEAEHGAHQAHLLEENGGKLPEPPAYEYLNRRHGGPFPWGANTLFFNPKVNKDMSKVDE